MHLENVFRKHSVPDLAYFSFAVLVALAVSAINLFDPINIYSYTRDVWHHMAVLNALMESPFDAVNPHIVSEAPSRTYMPWFFLMALVGKAFSLNALQVLGVSALLTMTTLIIGVRLFAKEYFQNDWAPLVLLASLLGGWGIEFNYVGLSNLETFVFSAGYPASIIMALGFFAWWAVLKYLKSPEKNYWYLGVILLITAFSFPTHHLQSGFTMGTMGVLAFFSRDGSFKKGVFVGLAIGAGLVLSSFWFYYNPFDFLLLGANNAEWETGQYWYGPAFIIFLVGIGYFGIFGFYDYKAGRWRWDLIIGFSAIMAGFLIGKFLGSPISHRFLPFWIFFLHIGLTGFILSWPLKLKFNEQIGCLPLLQKVGAFLLIASVSYHIYHGIHFYFAYKGFQQGTHTLPNKALHPHVLDAAKKLPAYFKPGDVLIAHREVAYPPQAFGIKLVSIPRPFPLVPDMAERQKASKDFFSEGFTNARRWEIIEKYNVTHILYRDYWAEKGVPVALRAFGDEIYINEELKLIPIDFSKKPSMGANNGDK